MQAHPLSSPAARIPFQSLPAIPPASPTQQPSPGHRASGSNPSPNPSPNPSLAPPTSPLDEHPGSGIAQGAGLAHDAGNLLGALGLYCDLLRVPGVLRPEHRHYATELGLISSRSSQLIRRLLALSPEDDVAPDPAHTPVASFHPPRPVPANPLPPHPDTSALLPANARRGLRQAELSRPGLTHASVLRGLAPVLERIAAGTATVSVFVPPALPAMDLPVEALERITVNLVRNAVEAIRGHQTNATSSASRIPGVIRVGLGIVSGRLQLTIQDNGPGIPPPIAAAFLRPAMPPVHSGRGLGHRIVHDLVSSTGGQISIRTRPGQGTAFCLKWPLDPSHLQESHPASHLSGSTNAATLRPVSRPATQEGLRSC